MSRFQHQLLVVANLLIYIVANSSLIEFPSNKTVSELWLAYEELFPTHLELVFHSAATLQEAHSQINHENTSNPERSNAIHCYDYSTGNTKATEYRYSGGYKTMVVSEIENIICFFAQTATPAGQDMVATAKFSTAISSAIKVHESIYHTIEKLQNEPNAIDATYLSVNFQYIDQTEGGNDNKTAPFSDIIAQLSSYSFKGFNKFFWSNAITERFFHDDTSHLSDADFQLDKIRQEYWRNLAADFALKIQNEAAGTHDFCNMTSLVLNCQYDRYRVKIPLSFISHIERRPDTATCFAYLIATLASDDATYFLALQNDPTTFNFRARSIQQTFALGNDVTVSPYTAAGLLGDNQIGSVADTGVDSTSCYFYDSKCQVKASSMYKPSTDMNCRKIIQYSFVPKYGDTSDVVEGHGTHVAGTMLGKISTAEPLTEGKIREICTGQYDGIAPNAKLVFLDMSSTGQGLMDPGDAQIIAPGYSVGARVHSNSWGTTYIGKGYYYGADIDGFLYKHPDMMVFYAAGNSGGDRPQTITMNAASKNVVGVGSSESSGGDISYIAWYSSIGPTYDNRFKPDLIAPGDSLMSAHSNGVNGQSCSTVFMTGTSMATPAAAGIALLVRQYFTDSVHKQFWLAVCRTTYSSCKSFTPSGVLAKAILLHSGTAMALYNGGGSGYIKLNAPPDSMQGFGLVTLNNVLPLKDKITGFDLFVDDLRSIGEYATIYYSVQVTSSKKPLKVTLSWYDPPSIDGSTVKALLQNLDLKMTTPTGTIYYGNGGTTPDIVNNNEQLYLSSASKGIYTITVSAKALPVSGSQFYSIVITSAGYVAIANLAGYPVVLWIFFIDQHRYAIRG